MKKTTHPVQPFSAFLIIALLVLALDQFTKWWARGLNYDILLTNFLFIQTTTNTGVSFGMLQQLPWIPTVIAVVVCAGILLKYNKIPKDWYWQLSCSLIFAGALGNLIDRVRYGSVTDFIATTFWPTFNVADSAIVVGGVIFLYAAYQKEQLEKHSRKK